MILGLLLMAIGLILRCTPATTPDTVYGALVEAGCLAQSNDGVQSIASEHATAGHPPWLDCMFEGGSVVSCHVPCD
jgi:hypothetical protein